MRNPDETLAAIDDVITWHGSDDAMVWGAADPGCDCSPNDACYVCVPCDICRDSERECGCGGDDSYDCYSCNGSGWRVPEHCCDCGGSPYCVKCHRCGASCAGGCDCPITVELESGATLTL